MEETQTQQQDPQAEMSWYTESEEEENSNNTDHLIYSEEDTVPTGMDQGTAPAQGQTAQPTDSKPVDWQKRYTDLQSYHDRKRVALEDELKQTANKYQDYDQLKNLRDAIATNPDLLREVEGYLNGTVQPRQVTQQQAQLPAKPADFDPLDAYDPSTPSGQWYQQMLAASVKQAVGDVQSLPQTVTQQVLSVIEQRERQKIQEEQQRQRDAAVRQEFEAFEQAHQDLTPESKELFLDFLAKGPQALGQQRLSLEHLYMVYNALVNTPPPDTQAPARPSPQDMLASKIRQVQQSTVPPSVTQIPAGGNNQPLTDEDYFNSSLARRGGPRWTIGK